MKKRSILLLAILLSFALFGCGESTTTRPDFTVKDGAYSCTPQEVISYLNAGIQGDDELLPIPDFVKSDEPITLSESPQFSDITFTTNDAGKVVDITFYFAKSAAGSDGKVLTTSGFHLGALLPLMMSEENSADFQAVVGAALSKDDALDGKIYDSTNTSVVTNPVACMVKLKAMD